MTSCSRCGREIAEGIRFCSHCGTAAGTGSDGEGNTTLFGMRQRIEAITRGRLEIIRELGTGGMGIVYLARQASLSREVAIKVLHPYLQNDAEIRARFRREVLAQGGLRHPNIMPIFDVLEENGLTYAIMPYITGGSLRSLLERTPRPQVDLVVRVLRELAEALGTAHRAGIIHRDVKPENILLDETHGHPILTDFGIARILASSDPSLTAVSTGHQIGSARYMPPEQFDDASAVDGRSDLYALGLVGYEMLAGRPVVESRNPAEIVYQHKFGTVPDIGIIRPDVPRNVATAIMQAIRKKPEERLATIEEFGAALDLPSPSVPRTVGSRVGRRPAGAWNPSAWIGTRRGQAIVFGAGVAIVSTVVFLVLSSVDGTRGPTIPLNPEPLAATTPDQPAQTPEIVTVPLETLPSPNGGPLNPESTHREHGGSLPTPHPSTGPIPAELQPGGGPGSRADQGPDAAAGHLVATQADPESVPADPSPSAQTGSDVTIVKPPPPERALTPDLSAVTISPSQGTMETEFQIDLASATVPEDGSAQIEFRWRWNSGDPFETDWKEADRARYRYRSEGWKSVTVQARVARTGSAIHGPPAERTLRVSVTPAVAKLAPTTVDSGPSSSPVRSLTEMRRAVAAAISRKDLAWFQKPGQGALPSKAAKRLRNAFEGGNNLLIEWTKDPPEVQPDNLETTMDARFEYSQAVTGERERILLQWTLRRTGPNDPWIVSDVRQR